MRRKCAENDETAENAFGQKRNNVFRNYSHSVCVCTRLNGFSRENKRSRYTRGEHDVLHAKIYYEINR